MISGLRPLVVWMANSLELLQFIQHQLPLILEWKNQEDRRQELNKEGEGDEHKEVENLGQWQCSYMIIKL